METFKKIMLFFLSRTVKEFFTSMIGLIIAVRFVTAVIITGEFSFMTDVPQILFSLYLFSSPDPQSIKDWVNKLKP